MPTPTFRPGLDDGRPIFAIVALHSKASSTSQAREGCASEFRRIASDTHCLTLTALRHAQYRATPSKDAYSGGNCVGDCGD